MTSEGEADVTSQPIMVKSDGEVDFPIGSPKLSIFRPFTSMFYA